MAKEIDFYAPLKKTESERLDLVRAFINQSFPYFHEVYQIADKNLRYYKGEQWTPEELALHRRQFRRAYVFNEIFNKIDNILGTHLSTKLDYIISARNRDKEKEAEQLRYLLKWVEKVCNIDRVENQVLRDMLIGGAGVTVIKWENEDIEYGAPIVKNVPLNQIMWDLNSIEPDLSDARWMARFNYYTKAELKSMFPGLTSLIDEISESSQLYGYIPDNLISFYRPPNITGDDEDNRFVPLIEFYDYTVKPTYVVYDEIANSSIEFEKKNEAEEFYRGKVEGYESNGIPVYTESQDPLVYIGVIKEKNFRQTIIAGDIILQDTEIATPFFPYDISFAYHFYGDFWPFVSQLISPQDLINRAFSQLDYQIGSSAKSGISVVTTLLLPDFSIEKVREEYSKTSPIIPVRAHDAFRPLPQAPIDPNLFNEVNFGLQRLIDYAGGHNILGLTDKAGESGKAVLARAQQAGITRLPFFERLKVWKMSVGAKLIWYIKNIMSEKQMRRIIGTNTEINVEDISETLIQSIKNLEYDLAIDEATQTQTIKEQYFEQLSKMFQQFPMAPEIVVPTLIEFSNLPESQKKDILSKLEFFVAYSQQKEQQKHEENLVQQATDVIKRKIIRRETAQQMGVNPKES